MDSALVDSFSEFIDDHMAGLRDLQARLGDVWARDAWDRDWASKPPVDTNPAPALSRVEGTDRYFVASTGMAPTIVVGDEIHVRQPTIELARKDIVVFQASDCDGGVLVKRVIGLSGETISVREGCVEIDGVRLDEPYVNGEYDGTPDFVPVTVPEDAVLLLGDNRHNSWDSRVFGPIDVSAIIGVVDLSSRDDP
jgi:signal peptidase I